MEAKWRHETEPALVARTDIVELTASFPGHRGFFHERYGLWLGNIVTDMDGLQA